MTLELLTFESNSTNMALPVETVASIYEAVAFNPSKHERKGILGDFNLHGEMIPVINLDKHWNREPNSVNLYSQIIVLSCGAQNTRVAIIADDVRGTISVQEQDVTGLKDILPETGLVNPHKFTIHQNEIYFVLDVEKLLADEDISYA